MDIQNFIKTRRSQLHGCTVRDHPDLPDQSVKAVATDPPFYDNVHYSELADFLHVWQRLWMADGSSTPQDTTRNANEVQDTDSRRFAYKLPAVFTECYRVLKDEGLLVFSYYHLGSILALIQTRAPQGA